MKLTTAVLLMTAALPAAAASPLKSIPQSCTALRKDGWTAPAAGLEASYSWIEGYLVTLRAGARRPEVKGGNPMTFGAVVAMLLGVALIACYVPAWRATRLNPTTALRAE